MKELVCITCPNSCCMTAELVNGEWKVTGNKCKRGEAFAKSEMTCPMRIFSTTVRTAWAEVPVLPVRVSGEIPRDKIFEVAEKISKITVREPLGRGEILIPDVLGLSVDVIITSDCLKDYLDDKGGK